MRIEQEQLKPSQSLRDLGLDSLMAVEIGVDFTAQTGLGIPPMEIASGPAIDALGKLLLGILNDNIPVKNDSVHGTFSSDVEQIDEENISTRKEDIKPLFEGQRLIGGYTQDDLATVWTSFRLHSDHFSRVLVHRRNLNPCQSGRLVQRLLEIETYRVMALMALPIAREVSAAVNAMDQELAQINAQISDIQRGEDERQLLKQLTTLAAKVERFHSDTNYRFGATNAYYELVVGRMAYLKLDEVEGVQSIPEFLMRRLTPAIRTCESAHRRLEDLSNRTSRAGELLNTRVDLTLKEQNQGLLASMNKRSEIQLRLQKMVEGMSVAAISFALVGLIRIALTAVKDGGWVDINLPLMIGLSVPTVVIVVWTVSRKVRKSLMRTP